MKYLLTLMILSITFLPEVKRFDEAFPSNALEGAWEMKAVNGRSPDSRAVLLIESPYVFYTEFDVDQKTFVGSQGGAVEIIANKLFYTTEFNTWDSNQVGVKMEMTAELKANELTLHYTNEGETTTLVFDRIDNGTGDLAGAWRITDRMQNDEMRAMPQGDRKTIKMITGSRFQWAAFNPATKQFSGTGGGTVTVENGNYTEHIEFFSRNSERVGASLSFNYKVDGNKWEHSGLSSSGSPIKEIWTRQ
ncbi:membrane or secreted protein [Roseivirga sp.]|uniref:membrane or secreted protein n=1 Tax=Roseivirga sp. TaxID=1964215 RepID=UPI003B519BFC